MGPPKSLTAMKTCLDEMGEFKGRDTALQKKLTKKGLQKCECLNINYFYRLYINDVDFLYNESSLQWHIKNFSQRLRMIIKKISIQYI